MNIYLASPYSGVPEEQETRFRAVCRIAGRLMDEGHIVFSPIAHSHPISIICNMPGSHDFWLRQNRGWMNWCDELWVAKIPGWKNSAGVKWEIQLASKLDKPVRYV